MRRRALALAVGQIFLAAHVLVAARLQPELLVEAPPELQRVAAAVRALASGDWEAELELTGTRGFEPAIRVVLLPESSQEARTTPSWVSAYTLGATSQIVVFPARVPSYPDRNLETLLRHEIAHVLVARASGGGEVPRWLHEGIATVAAREWGIEDGARFAMAVIGQRPASTADLDRGFSAGAAAAARSYALSAAFVRHLRQRFGPDAPARVLHRLSTGRPFADAFVLATGAELGAVERDFFGKEVFWNTWFPFLTSSAVLWMGISLLALVAIRRRRQKDEELRALWRDEEGLETPASTDEPEVDPGRGDPMRFN